MLDVVVQYAYCGHRGKSYIPPDMHKAERRLRITVDETRTVSAIRDEVLQRKEIIPKPYQFLGSTTKTGSGFELDEKDLVRHVSSLFSIPPWEGMLGRLSLPSILSLKTPLCLQIASRGEHMLITIDYRKDATKGYPKAKSACEIMRYVRGHGGASIRCKS